MAKRPEVVVPLFRHSGPRLDNVPTVAIPLHDQAASDEPTQPASPPVDLGDRPRFWLLIGAGGSGKTTYARWLISRMMEQGRTAALAALDPANRTLASWFKGVEQPPGRDSATCARWLSDSLDELMEAKQPAVIDFGGGDMALETVVRTTDKLAETIEEAGLGLVACYPLTPRVESLAVLQNLEAQKFQPRATVLLLNEGTADPTLPARHTFALVTGHPIYRAAVERGAIPIWMPWLDSEVMQEIEAKRLHFDLARDGHVPPGASFPPIGGLRRSKVRRWLNWMEQRHEPIKEWLP